MRITKTKEKIEKDSIRITKTHEKIIKSKICLKKSNIRNKSNIIISGNEMRKNQKYIKITEKANIKIQKNKKKYFMCENPKIS